MEVLNPATGAAITNVAADTADTIRTRHAAALEALPAWAATPLDSRIATLRRFRSRVVDDLEDLAVTLTRETGKPITQSRGELNALLPRIDFFVDHVADAIADNVVFRDADDRPEEVISQEPLGLVTNISAWNYPYFVGSNVFVPALLTGNVVLYKPSELATLTGLAIGEMLHDSGIPDNVFQVIVGQGEVGAELLAHRADGFFFTGSHRTGQLIAEAAARHLARVQLELGGKDPVYVADDADPTTAAVALADGAFYNNGQSCCSVERIYLHRSIHDEFLAAFVTAVDEMAMGDPMNEATYLGPLTRPAQAAVLEAQIADASDRGAKVVRGGGRRPAPGTWFEPTVISGADHTMAVMHDESFGPVIAIMAVDDDDHAVGLMNDTAYGLTAGVFSSDRGRAESLLRRVVAGSAYWNCCDRVSPRLPWSGRGHSGIGSTLSISGILAFTHPKAWHLRRP